MQSKIISCRCCFIHREYQICLMQILNLNPNLPRYWIQLSRTYRPENLDKSFLCLLLAKSFSTTHNLQTALEELANFSADNPGFDESKVSLKSQNLASLTKSEDNEEFADLGRDNSKFYFFRKRANLENVYFQGAPSG